jgi:hypothetical protein
LPAEALVTLLDRVAAGWFERLDFYDLANRPDTLDAMLRRAKV